MKELDFVFNVNIFFYGEKYPYTVFGKIGETRHEVIMRAMDLITYIKENRKDLIYLYWTVHGERIGTAE